MTNRSKLKISPGPWDTNNMDGQFFPSVFIGPAGLVYSDGSGDPNEREYMVVNVGPSPEDVAKGWRSNSMATCQDNARAIASVPDMLAFVRMVSRQDTIYGRDAMALRRKMGDA